MKHGTTRTRGRRSRTAWIVAGDGESLSEAERGQRRQFWQHVLRARVGATVAIPIVVMLLSMFGPNRFALALAAAIAGTVSNLVLRHQIRHGGSIPSLIAATDLITALAFIAVTPVAYPVAITVIVSMTSLYVFWFGRRTTVQLLVPTGIALLAIGIVHRPEMWVSSWIAWVITSVFGTMILASVAEVSIESRNRYNDLVNGIDALVWEATGEGGDADYVSERVLDLLGFTPDEFASFAFLTSRVHPDDLETLIESRRQISDGTNVEVHYRICDAQGRTRHLNERVRVAKDAEGRTRYRRGVMVDETARWEAERSVRGYADFIEGIPVALAILRLDDLDDPTSIRVVTGNPASAQLVGVVHGGLIGRHLGELFDTQPDFLERLADVARLSTTLERPAVRIGPDDAVYSLRALPLPDQCIGITLEDVTKRARVSESLRHQAMHDHLTGLPNRAQFGERLAAALERASNESTDADTTQQASLIMMDLNHFKEVNDTLGHEYGDRLLIDLARRLSRNLRDCDSIARLGGDEFAILLSGPSAGTNVDEVAQRVHELTGQPFQIDEHRLQVGCSIGIAVFPDHADDAVTLMRHADGAMYLAKEAGGGIVRYASGDDLTAGTRLELLADLHSAVQSDEMIVHYQPRIDLTSLRPLGVEALVRWRHPERGLLPPGDFIELAEVSGVISALTRLVTERATTEMHHLDGAHDLGVSINLSGRNLQDPMLISWVTELLERTGFPPASLCFELTEAQLAADPAQALEALHRLRMLGVRLSVDDFGTGYSSLAYLRELPIDEVKIDPSFIADLDSGDTILVRSVIQLAHNLGLHVVAEGVETPSALATLRELGCDSAQGFHFAVPMSLLDLTEFLADHDGSPEADASSARGGAVDAAVATPPPERGMPEA